MTVIAITLTLLNNKILKNLLLYPQEYSKSKKKRNSKEKVNPLLLESLYLWMIKVTEIAN